MTRILKTDALDLELVILNAHYTAALEQLARRVEDAQARQKAGRVSNHDGFNMSATCNEIQGIATKIEYLKALIGCAVEAEVL